MTLQKVITWICNQNYSRSQLDGVTRAQLRNIAEAQLPDITPEQIRQLLNHYNTIINSVWSDWRKKRIEAARSILEDKVHEYDADATVVYDSESSDRSVFTVSVNLNLERS